MRQALLKNMTQALQTSGVGVLRAAAAAAVLLFVGSAMAQQSAQEPKPGKRRSGDSPIAVPCVEEASAFHGVNPMLMRAIIFHESRGNPSVVMRNTNGSIDVGLGQLNSIHFKELARYGIAPEHLLDGCVNTYVAAWHLAKQVKQYGNTWTAVGTYHSRTPVFRDRYASQIYSVLQRWRAVP